MNEEENTAEFQRIEEVSEDLGKTYFIDQAALESMKVLLAENDIEPDEDLTDFHNSVAKSSYDMARAMWAAKNGELEDVE